VLGTTQDVTERKAAEAENRKLALAIARTHNAVILTDAEGRIEWVNEGFTRITGYSAAEALGRKPGAFLQGPQTDPETVRRMSAAIRAGEGFQVEILNYTKAGRSYWLSIEAQPLHDAGGRLTGFMAIEADITERKLAAEKLASEQARLQAVIDASPAVIYACRLNGDWPATFISANVTEHFGYSPQECLQPGWWVSTLHPEDRDRILAGVAALLEKGRHVHEYRMATKAGDWRWVHDELVLLRDAHGKPFSATGALLDITERKLAESAQQKLLAERTTLLDEVHHRVKNNLQVVSSLLMLQQGSSQDATLIEQLQLSRDRVAAIAQVHEQLYRTQNFAQVDFGDYLRDLLAGLARSNSASEKNIELQVLGGGVVLTLGEAVPCALLVNELVSNALKHAFPAGRSGRVWVELALGEDGSRTVRVGDDGVGLAPNADATAPLGQGQGQGQGQGLGLTLVRRLSAQLQGTLERQATEVGTLWCLRFGRMMEQGRLASL
jgi:PAS domain S-box-containing protein